MTPRCMESNQGGLGGRLVLRYRSSPRKLCVSSPRASPLIAMYVPNHPDNIISRFLVGAGQVLSCPSIMFVQNAYIYSRKWRGRDDFTSTTTIHRKSIIERFCSITTLNKPSIDCFTGSECCNVLCWLSSFANPSNTKYLVLESKPAIWPGELQLIQSHAAYQRLCWRGSFILNYKWKMFRFGATHTITKQSFLVLTFLVASCFTNLKQICFSVLSADRV